MRVVLATSLLLLLGCGGASQKPAEGATGDTAALESSPSATADTPSTVAPSDSKPAPAHAAPPASSPSDSPAAAAPAPFHPTPGATGSIDGKPFAPKLALVSGPMQKDGRVPLTITEHPDCATPAKTGDGSLTMLVAWKSGYKTDLGSLRAGKKSSSEIGFSRLSAANKASTSPKFKPTGTVTIVTAPMDQGATGKMKIDLQSGDYMLAGDLDVQVCVAPK